MANNKFVSHKANSTCPTIEQVRRSFATNILYGKYHVNYEFDIEEKYSNEQTREFFETNNIEDVIADLKVLAKELLKGKHYIRKLDAKTWKQDNAYDIRTYYKFYVKFWCYGGKFIIDIHSHTK